MTQINLTSTADVTLKTAGKYCEDDIKIVQNLEEITATPTDEVQEFVPSEGKNGISRVVVNETPTEDVEVKSTEDTELVMPSDGKFIRKVTVKQINLQNKSVTPSKESQTVVKDGGFDALKMVSVEPIPEEYVVPEGSLEITENNTYDVTDKASVVVNVASTGSVNGLQWKIDNMKSLANEFRDCKLANVDGAFEGLDTSAVEDVSSMFYNAKITSAPIFNTSGVKTASNMFYQCSVKNVPEYEMPLATTLYNMFYYATSIKTLSLKNLRSVDNAEYMCGGSGLQEVSLEGLGVMSSAKYMFNGCSSLTSVNMATAKPKNCSYMFKNCKKLVSVNIDLSELTNAEEMFVSCSALESFTIDTPKVWSVKTMFSTCSNLKSVHMNTSTCSIFTYFLQNCTSLESASFDVINASSLSSLMQNNYVLTDLLIKNIKKTLKIGSGTSWGHLLTDESLINTAKELWDLTGSTSQTLTVSTTSNARFDEIYVKLTTATDEMITEDPNIASKKPCVVCESTDEGAMTLREYVMSKNWALA